MITILFPFMFSFLLPADGPHNTLSKMETKLGWQLLFDGKSTAGWHNFRKPGNPKSQWMVEDGTLCLGAPGGGDIVSDSAWENFEFRVEWKISEKGNSGIFFAVSEEEKFDAIWRTGPEMQILDDEGHPDGKFPSHRAGANYDLHESQNPLDKKPGEWNLAEIRVLNGKVSYRLNGKTTVEYTLLSPEWEEQVKKSKFRDMPFYGRTKKGHIALQDHGDKVWFRNLKIRKL
jgi:hypothetical protein